MCKPVYDLVYQAGIANVFGFVPALGKRQRLLQGAYRECELFLRGAAACGAQVEVYHCDQAGDVLGQPWKIGKGELWASSKHPPECV